MTNPFETMMADVPVNRTRLEVWCETHGIHAIHWGEDEGWETYAEAPWEAVKQMPDSTWRHGYGETEEAACQSLAQNLRLPFLESIPQPKPEAGQ